MVLIYGQGYPPRLMLSIVIDVLGASPLLNYHSPAWKIAKRLKSNHLARPFDPPAVTLYLDSGKKRKRGKVESRVCFLIKGLSWKGMNF